LLGRLFQIENTAPACQLNDWLNHQQFNLFGENSRGTTKKFDNCRLFGDLSIVKNSLDLNRRSTLTRRYFLFFALCSASVCFAHRNLQNKNASQTQDLFLNLKGVQLFLSLLFRSNKIRCILTY
jgi:hypothetical protein